MGSLLDGLEKLISEHGSATILRERISLANDKYAALERKASDFEIENKTLKSNLEEMAKKVDRLNKIIQASQENQGIKQFKEIEKQILKYFFDTNEQLYASNIASRFSLNIGATEYHLNNLLESELIGDLLAVGDDTRYYIKTKGRTYIMGNT